MNGPLVSAHPRIILPLLLALVTAAASAKAQEIPEPSAGTVEYPPTAEWVIRDWSEALRFIKAEDEKGFAAHVMSPEFFAVLVHPMSELIAAGAGAHEKVAVVGATHPADPRGGWDTFLAAGPFSVESETLIAYEFESGGEYRMKLQPEKEYFFYVQMTHEKDENEREDKSLAHYRFQSVLIPMTIEQVIEEVTPIKKQLDLGDDEYRFVTFSEHGEAIRRAIETAWAEE